MSQGVVCACNRSLHFRNFKVLCSKHLFEPRHGSESCKWIFCKSFNKYYHTASNSFNSIKRTIPISLGDICVNGNKYSTVSELSAEQEKQNDDFMANRRDLHDYTSRSHSCGELRSSHIGQKVELYGWVSHIRMNKFILLRDYYGVTQIMVPELEGACQPEVHLESVACVTGIVRARPPSQVRKDQDTGEIEVHALSLEIINNATANLPFHIRELPNKANSKTLNRYRFLALRFHDLQSNLRLRSELLFKMREFLITRKKFVEVETPTLFKKTPGGAQEFIVPTHEKNKFYSLVQSPQQLKQLLMVGSVDRYFQIARCYRDETTTADRQPEFTQLDVEISFTDTNSVMNLTEDVLAWSWPNDKVAPKIPFPRMRYQDAIENYGSDKPCLLDKFLIQNMKPYLLEETNYHIYMCIIPRAKSLHKKLKTHFETLIQENSVKIYVIHNSTVEKLFESLSKIVVGFDVTKFRDSVTFQSDDLLLLAKGSQKLKTLKVLGLCRHHVIDELKLIEEMNAKGIYDFLWIVDFPLFESKENGEIKSSHHPFTQPHPEDVQLLSSDVLKVRSLAYDLVLNGSEIGGGSIRIHDFKLQEQILNILGLKTKDFNHLLEALQMGCPPHGGIALGIDRLLAIVCNRKSIRDVIAFPKGSYGQDNMTECPSDVPDEDKIRYHIPIDKSEN